MVGWILTILTMSLSEIFRCCYRKRARRTHTTLMVVIIENLMIIHTHTDVVSNMFCDGEISKRGNNLAIEIRVYSYMLYVFISPT